MFFPALVVAVVSLAFVPNSLNPKSALYGYTPLFVGVIAVCLILIIFQPKNVRRYSGDPGRRGGSSTGNYADGGGWGGWGD